MRDFSTAEQAVGFLLGLTDEDTAARVRRRIGLPGPEAPEAARGRLSRAWTRAHDLPASLILWVLEEDDPELNAVVWRFITTDSGLRRAVARGVPFGSGRTEAVPVSPALRTQEPEVPESYVRHGLVGALRDATTMKEARSAESMVLTRADWRAVTEADGERPLPGYARWALSVRPDCPPALRAQFGSHRKFTHRVRQAGVLDGPPEYATTYRPALRVLQVLSMGHVLFPTRVREAENALRPLVRDHLGDREDAWAVLAQLIGTFHGTAPELLMTAGAIA
ncbi:hypothetical protein ACIPSA_13995 [Streptomyces sp. NPDC086549]|uniref:hypothetical protein n=1 Tax=Streptomyces sp. NPDC086549 TaxID=3365752 RepID=UPI00381F7A3C